MSSSATPTSGSGSASGSGHPQDADAGTGRARGRTHQAGAFDIRTLIGALIGIYGLVLTVYGIVGPSDTQRAKADGVNINLWAGIAMVVVAVVFLVWARLRPVIVPDQGPDAS